MAENWHDFDGSDPTEPPTGTGDATDKSRDRATRFVYNGLDQLALLVALDMNADGTLDDNQTTRYLYEDPVAANRVTSEIYPDSSDTTSSGTDQVKLAYALDGRQTSRTDQRGVVIEMTYNARRQLELADATSLGGSGFVDDFVRSIERTYDTLGRLTLITSYAAAGGTGTIRNQVALEYNGLDQVTASEQSHTGAVDDSPRVEYVYDDSAGSGRYLHQHRLSEVIYPAGRTVHHDYGSGRTDRLGLVAALRETDGMGTAWTSYSYTGTGRLALAAYPEVSVALDYFQGTTGTYAGWDRFGRVIDQRWTGAMDDVDRFGYGYDAAGSRLWRDLDDAVYAADDLDQVFGYDGLHRLVTSEEGTFDGTGIDGTPAREEAWTLDALGNWAALEQEEGGQSVLSQTRTHNKANELTAISNWQNPLHDAAGNMLLVPRPDNPTAVWGCQYDAWNRLVRVINVAMAQDVARYEYDGLNRRVVKNLYDGGSLDHRLHFYYNESWQVLEVRREEDSTQSEDPVEQFVWHPYYIDALATRFWDADADGMAIEQHYFTHDANFNVTAALDDSGDAVERYHYSAYGEVLVLEEDFSPAQNNASTIDHWHLYTGRERDPESGLQLNRNRYYHPTLGRWVSRDPISYDGSQWNLYEFDTSNPLARLDPSGLAWHTCRRDWTITLPRSRPRGQRHVVCYFKCRCLNTIGDDVQVALELPHAWGTGTANNLRCENAIEQAIAQGDCDDDDDDDDDPRCPQPEPQPDPHPVPEPRTIPIPPPIPRRRPIPRPVPRPPRIPAFIPSFPIFIIPEWLFPIPNNDPFHPPMA